MGVGSGGWLWLVGVDVGSDSGLGFTVGSKEDGYTKRERERERL